MDVSITILDNGPIQVEGGDPSAITILDAQGRPFGLAGRTVIKLCRCGQSSNKPFCDGTHRRAGFQSVCEARDLPEPKPKL
jgi:CDGSH-type Zn-finger protein